MEHLLFEIDACLERIRLAGAIEPTEDRLEALHPPDDTLHFEDRPWPDSRAS